MRELTASQKKLLTATLKKAEPSATAKAVLGERNTIQRVEDLPSEIWNKLEEMNDTEILYQEVDRFIDDWHWAKLR